ncbi:MAG TPA: hypothetical protein VH308_08240 [Terracidiphilus sp.]|jgi:hypothetical protein|nr:hypothetical protein [Terracidiphilus sp.]
MTALRASAPLRGTQSMVGYMGWVFSRPSTVAIEIGWRWIFGIPLLLVFWKQLQQILAAYPLESSGFNSLDAQNPWVAIVQLANVWSYYQPHVFAVLHWLVPASALCWVVISGLGRTVVLSRLNPQLPSRPAALIVLQAAWLALLGLIFWLWFGCMRWAAASHISAGGEPDLVGFAVWAIFLTLAFFTAWALISWALSIAPLIMLLENRSVLSALGQSLRLGKSFTGKLAEVNLVMGIVKLALIVLAMVFSAAPLPFSDELGSASLHVVTAASTIFYLVASDYFHVVRLKGFMEFWRTYRGSAAQ